MQFWALCKDKVWKCFQQLKNEMIRCPFSILESKAPIPWEPDESYDELFLQENAISTFSGKLAQSGQ